MHAKMTRDRKKLFISSVEKTIAELESNNKRMRAILAKQAIQHAVSSNKSVTPLASPILIASDVSTSSIPPLLPTPNENTSANSVKEQEEAVEQKLPSDDTASISNAAFSAVA